MTRSRWISLLAAALCSSAVAARLQSPVQVLALTHVAVLPPGGHDMQRDLTVVGTADGSAHQTGLWRR